MLQRVKILQITPATGWRAIYEGSDKGADGLSLYWQPVICWALVEGEVTGRQDIYGVSRVELWEMEFAPDSWDWVCYLGPDEDLNAGWVREAALFIKDYKWERAAELLEGGHKGIPTAGQMDGLEKAARLLAEVEIELLLAKAQGRITLASRHENMLRRIKELCLVLAQSNEGVKCGT